MLRNHLMIAAVAAFLCANPARAEERDPFQPFGAQPAVTATVPAPAPAEDADQTNQSLMAYPLDSFKLVGVLIAEQMPLAVLQGRDAKDYIVTTGDKVGKEGGTVSVIRKDGITVAIGDNKMDMPVSNKVEKVNDKAKK